MRSPSPVQRSLSRSAQRAVLAAIAIGTALPAAADAGTYHQWGCRTPTGAIAPADGWDSGGTPPGAVVSSCASGGNVGVIAGDASGSATASMAYYPGPNLSATSATFWRSARASQNVPFNQPPNYLVYYMFGFGNNQFDASGGYAPLETGYGDNSGTAAGPVVPSIAGSTMDAFDPSNRLVLNPIPQDKPSAPLKIDVACGQWSGQYSCDARYLLTSYDIKLRDDTSPVASVVAGTLVNGNGKIDPTLGPVSGTRTVIILGSDTGSGLYRTVVEVDGNEAASGKTAPPATGANRCSAATAVDGLRAYLVRQPCPLNSSATASWDSATVKDGAHDLRVFLEDASGNKTLVTEGKILVRNDPTTGPGSPDEFRGEANGSVVTDTATLALTWPRTARKPSSRKSTIRKCAKRPKWAAKNVVKCQGRPAAAEYSTTWSRSKVAQVDGRLVDGAGQPIANAAVRVSSTPSAVGAAGRQIGTVNTDANGAFTLTVPRSEGSQTIVGEWMARSGDTRAAAATTATLAVKAATGVNAPKRARRGATVAFSGTLRGKAASMGAVPVTLEVRYRGRWKTFANATTAPTGKWSVKVRRFATQRGSYPVRVRTGVSSTYPFAAGGGTRTVTIRVR